MHTVKVFQSPKTSAICLSLTSIYFCSNGARSFPKEQKKRKNFDFHGTIILFLEHTVNKSEYTIGEILEEGKALLSNSST